MTGNFNWTFPQGNDELEGQERWDDLLNVTDSVLRCQESLVPIMLHASLGPAVIIVCLLCFLQRRRNKCVSCCGGRPAVAEPLNLLDQYDNRWTYAAVFGAIPNFLISVFLGLDGQYFLQTDFPTYLKSLYTMAYVQNLCLSFFPLFACLNTQFKLTGSLIGLGYSLFWFTVKMQGLVQCSNPYPEEFGYITVVINLPSNICLGIVVVRYLVVSIENIKNRTWSKDDYGVKIAPDHMILYVKKLLSKPPATQDGPTSAFQRVKGKIRTWLKENVHDKDLHFKYSPRIISAFAATIMCTYLLGSVSYWISENFLTVFKEAVLEFNNATDDAFRNRTFIGRNIENIYFMIEFSWLIPSTLCSFLYAFWVVRVLINYRKHTLMLYKGDTSFIPQTYEVKPTACIAFTVRFAGYQIAYMLWGQILLTLVGFLIFLLFSLIIVLPPLDGNWTVLQYIVEVLGIPAAVSLFIFIIQDIAASVFFTQNKIDKNDEAKPLALENIRVFRFWDYFMFVNNITTGLFSCLWRVAKSLLLGLMFLSRMDRSVLMAGFERSDTGFNAYIGMMMLERYNNHPILRTFCQLLGEAVLQNHYYHHKEEDEEELRIGSDKTLELNSIETNEMATNAKKPPSAALKRWHLAYTLIHNPKLREERRQFVEEDEESEKFFKKIIHKLTDLRSEVGTKLKKKLPRAFHSNNKVKDNTTDEDSLHSDDDVITEDIDTLKRITKDLKENTDENEKTEDPIEITDESEISEDKLSLKTSEAYSISDSEQLSEVGSSRTNSIQSVVQVNKAMDEDNEDNTSNDESTAL